MDAETTATEIAYYIWENLAEIDADDAAAIIASALAAAAPVWQPISTAPKDGQAVILYAQGEVCPGWYDDGLDPDGNEYDEPGWYWFDQHEQGPCEPTHWQPLPAPPNPEAGND